CAFSFDGFHSKIITFLTIRRKRSHRSRIDKPIAFWIKETKIERFDHNDQRYILSSKCGAFKPESTVPAVTHGSGSIMFWGSFFANGAGTEVG
uniref:Uncharacterized protein n=1 Tax=Pundamilia nyererei TaxID=303518 RepID=A0A3B4F3I5_9CICH